MTLSFFHRSVAVSLSLERYPFRFLHWAASWVELESSSRVDAQLFHQIRFLADAFSQAVAHLSILLAVLSAEQFVILIKSNLGFSFVDRTFRVVSKNLITKPKVTCSTV